MYSPTTGLFNLPDEVLEIALKALLPPFKSQSLAETYAFTVPVDLLAARLVCRRFHRIATPFAWRRAQLQITSPDIAKFYGNVNKLQAAAPVAARKHSLCPLARCRFFDENSHLASHIRVLLVSIEWHAAHPERARDALRAATRAMSSLRTILVWDDAVLPFLDIRALLQRPLLRAARLMDVDGCGFPVHGSWGAGLKMLHIANSVCPARLLAGAAASLECVSIELTRARGPVTQPAPTLRDMPWKTLREVALVDCVYEDDWSSFIEGFQRHKRSARLTPLTELIIGDLNGLEPTRISKFLQTFGGHPLRRLSIYNVIALDASVFTAIVSAFPVLFELTLLTEGELVAWPGALDTYAQSLARLPHLVSLAWNNFGLDSPTYDAFPSLGNPELGALYAEHARILARYMRTLRYVRLTSIVDRIVDTIRVDSDALDPSGTVDVTRSEDSAFLDTSSWSTSSVAFEDI